MRLIRRYSMKRKGFIFEDICSTDNIKLAIMKASLGKRDQRRVARILENIDVAAEEISKILRNKEYFPSPYTIKIIKDGSSGKERKIYKPRFYPDQIVHWALMLQIQPIIMRGMYEYSCGSIPGRGASYGQKALSKWLKSDRAGTKYCLKIDISKFYPSVNNEILKGSFRRIIKDRDCLWLIDTIIDSETGLPIGNYTSQWFSNFFLQGLDHYIKEQLHVKYYIRYVDDGVLLGSNKRKLHSARKSIDAYLSTIGLALKDNWQVFRTNSRPIDFLGYKFYRDRVTLRKRNALRIKRRIKKIARKPTLAYRDACAVVSYWGWIKRSNSYHYYEQHVKPFVSLRKAKGVIRKYGKKNSLRRHPGV